jgi:hypothetical protein
LTVRLPRKQRMKIPEVVVRWSTKEGMTNMVNGFDTHCSRVGGHHGDLRFDVSMRFTERRCI